MSQPGRVPAPSARPLRAAPGEVERRTLFRGLGLGIDDFCCRVHVHSEGAEEPNPTHSIAFVRRGLFVRRARGEAFVADPNQILFFNQGEPYRYAHPLPGGDDCTVIALAEDSLRALLQHTSPRAAEEDVARFRRGHAPASPRAARLQNELLAASCRPEQGLVRQDLVLELVHEALRAQHGEDRREAPGASAAGSRRRRDLAEAAKLILNRRHAAPPSLEELALELGCSPFHLVHVFRAVTGSTLRGYLRALRARLAAERLARGATDLTQLALELGYCDHSHFTNAFRREFGVPPSRLAPGRRYARSGRQARDGRPPPAEGPS